MTKAIRKEALNPRFLQTLKPAAKRFLVWDSKQGGLALAVQPNGHMAWKAIYNHRGRTRWYTIGTYKQSDGTEKIGLSDARKVTERVLARVVLEEDPQAEKKEAVREAARREAATVTFEALASRYVENHAKKNNRSWKQADYLVRRHALPLLGARVVSTIERAEVKELMRAISAPVVANQTLAAISAIFTWAIKEEIGGVKDNPCKLVARNEVKDRERVLSDSELPLFWSAFDEAGLIASTALKLILLTGQRPGEVARMRHEHIRDGWWEMPGKPDPATKWPGTKNGESHRVWLAAPVQELLAALEDDRKAGFVLPVARLDTNMRDICERLGIKDKVTPHDLRRTNGTTITSLGFGRPAMNRVQNHKEGGIASVYDRHEYAKENKRMMEAVAARIVALATGQGDDNVVPMRERQKPGV